MTPLCSAAGRGSYRMAKILLENGEVEADLELSNNDGMTPLYLAALKGKTKLLRLLIEKGGNINTQKKHGWTPINAASLRGHLEAVRLLLACGADITTPDETGMSPLYNACANGHTEIARLLLEKGADPNMTTNNGWKALNTATDEGHVEVVKILLEHDADVLKPDGAGMEPFYCAALEGNLELMKIFYEKGGDVNETGQTDGWSAISAAGSNGHIDAVKFLLDKGADLSTRNARKRTALHTAALNGHVGVVNTLIESQKVNLDDTDDSCRSALALAALRGYSETVKALTSKGASIDLKDIWGSTALHVAVRNGHFDVIEHLLSLTAPEQLSLEDGWGRDLVWWALGSNNDQVVKLVREYLQERKITVPHKSEGRKCYPVTFDSKGSWCDSCGRCIPKADPWHKCDSCYGFDICEQCFSFGPKCPGDSHEWTRCEPETEPEGNEEEKEEKNKEKQETNS
ncbi:hypothetical protein N7470_004031 [Penicillium chermesinum]|nr:hypothetical protein N7470_004031 [Penicillium chermesinum]